MAVRVPKPENLFIGIVLVVLLAGVTLQITGWAPRVGFWMAVGGFALA